MKRGFAPIDEGCQRLDLVTTFMKRITVLLADDNRVVRKAFRTILELEAVGGAEDGLQAVAVAKTFVRNWF